MSGEVWWLVSEGNAYRVVVEAGSEKQAREKALDGLGFTHKPYLAGRLEVRIATKAEKEEYVAFAEAHRKSEPTIRTTKRKGKSARDRLFGG
jgi:hypothetical protein